MNHIHKSALRLASEYTAPELRGKLSFWESSTIPYSSSMVRALKMALSFKVPSPFIILKNPQAEESRKYSKLSSEKEETSIIEVYKNINGVEHSVYVDYKEAKFLDELGLSGHFHVGNNTIEEEQAEFLIPILRGKIPSLRRKVDVKKMNNFIEKFISSYGPDFRDEWINNTHAELMCYQN